MEMKSMANIWKGKAWKIYGKGGKFKDGSARVERGEKNDSLGWGMGQYASQLCSGNYRPCGAGGFFLWRGSEFLMLLFILFVIFVSECSELLLLFFFSRHAYLFDLVEREKRVRMIACCI
jgi:hypothetical protein